MNQPENAPPSNSHPDDPTGIAEPHDVLAAEEFAMPAAEPRRRGGRVVLPDDPSGIEEPHDVLAAEEFAMPAAERPGGTPAAGGRRQPIAFAAAALALVAFWRRRRRR